jgi:tetratricopeptide (TPR) repeat protein
MRALGPDHLATLVVQSTLGVIMTNSGRAEQAVSIYQDLAGKYLNKLGARDPETLKIENNLACALRTVGRMEEARQKFAEVWRARLEVLGATHMWTIYTEGSLGECLRDLKQLPQAEEHVSHALAEARKHIPADHPYRYDLLKWHGRTMLDVGRFAAAESSFSEWAAAVAAKHGTRNGLYLVADYLLAQSLERQKRLEAAECKYRAIASTSRELLDEQHWHRWVFQAGHGACLRELGRLPRRNRCWSRAGSA